MENENNNRHSHSSEKSQRLSRARLTQGISTQLSSLADALQFTLVNESDDDPYTTKSASSSTSKKLLNKTLDKTLQHAKEAVHFATDTTNDLLDAVGQATDFTRDAIEQVAQQTKKGIAHVGQRSRGMVSETSEAARDIALHMSRSFLGNTPLTLYLPEVLLNSQIRKRIDRSEIDNITIHCGNNRFDIEIDGHYGRFLYRLNLYFDVLECRIGQEKYLRLKQIDESLDLQLRHASTMTNWATKKMGRLGFEIINRLPIATLINHLIKDIPGIHQERHRYWYIDLEQAGFIDFLNNRSWMVEKLINLTDFNILPGLNILRQSKEWVKLLVDQFEICGLCVQNGRLEIQVCIAQPKNNAFN